MDDGIKFVNWTNNQPTAFSDAFNSEVSVGLITVFDALAYNGMQINGSMEVSQFNGTNSVSFAAGTSSAYVIDQWHLGKSGSMAIAAQQVADAPVGYTNSLKVTVSTAEASLGANDYVYVRQPIEGYRTSRLAFGTANASSVSFGFWTKHYRTGTWSGSVYNSATNRSYPFDYTQNASGIWEYKTVTVSGDITGTWVGNTNGIGLWVSFCVAVGSTYAGAAGVWANSLYFGSTDNVNGVASVSDTFQISGVIILPGIELPPSSRASFIMRSYDLELPLCQRLFSKSFTDGTVPGNSATENNRVFGMEISVLRSQRTNYPVSMRAAPTMVFYSANVGTPSNGQWSAYVSGAWVACTGTTLDQQTDKSFSLYATAAGVVEGSPYLFTGHWTADIRF